MATLQEKNNVIEFRPRQLQVAEHREGYSRVMNTLIEALAGARISQHEHQVVWAIIRKTLGWGKDLDRISGSQLAEMTKLTREQCSRALAKLIAKGLVIRHGGAQSAIEINQDFASWKLADKPQKSQMCRLNKNGTLCRKTATNQCRNPSHTKDKKEINYSPSENCHLDDDAAKAAGNTNAKTASASPPPTVPPEDPKESALPVAPKAIRPDAVPYQAILDAYHEILPELPRVRVFNKARKSSIKARWFEDPRFQTLDFWKNLFAHVRACDFLMGRAKPSAGRRVFFADFDFITAPKSFVKTIEGKYDNE